MKVSVIVVTYNSMKYLPDFLDSVLAQSYYAEKEEIPDILVIDNGSSDGTIKYIHDNYPQVKFLRNTQNIGLTKAWNKGIRMTHGEYILIMNPDLIMDKDFIKKAEETMASEHDIASVGGKLYRLNIESDGELSLFEKTNILDNCGIQIFKNWRFIDRGAGEEDSGQYDQTEEVFGISGTLVLYRRAALEAVKFREEFFDEDFFMYKDDVDMALRLKLNGWKAVYSHTAVAYHNRRAKSQSGKVKNLEVVKYRRSKENFVNYHSCKNHWMIIAKNILPRQFARHWPFIFWYESKKFFYMLIMETGNLAKSILFVAKNRSKIVAKRKFVMQSVKIRLEEIMKWFA